MIKILGVWWMLVGIINMSIALWGGGPRHDFHMMMGVIEHLGGLALIELGLIHDKVRGK